MKTLTDHFNLGIISVGGNPTEIDVLCLNKALEKAPTSTKPGNFVFCCGRNAAINLQRKKICKEKESDLAKLKVKKEQEKKNYLNKMRKQLVYLLSKLTANYIDNSIIIERLGCMYKYYILKQTQNQWHGFDHMNRELKYKNLERARNLVASDSECSKELFDFIMLNKRTTKNI